MACQWNQGMVQGDQRTNGQGMAGTAGMTTGPQVSTCPQMTNIRTRTQQGTPSAGMQMQPSMGPGTALMPPVSSDTPSTVQSPYYTAGFLRNFIGCNMRVEFLIGTSGALVDRIGVLMEVGASYIVLQPFQTDDLLMCDLYSIKFVTIYG